MIVPLVPLRGGLTAPQIGLGTWRLTGREGTRAVELALDLGYRHVDTADSYGNEADIAPALRGIARDQLFLVSKVWWENLARDALRASAEQSLRRLRTDYLDLLLIHWPSDDVPLEQSVAELLALQDEGKIRGWGVSNFSAARVARAATLGDPATNQVEVHPWFAQEPLARTCRAHGIPLTGYAPLARGRVNDEPVLRAIAGRHGVTPGQVALRWSMRRGNIVIPRSRSEAHLRENLRAVEVELDDDDMAAIGALPQQRRLVDAAWALWDD